jgi:hypothetical protein
VFHLGGRGVSQQGARPRGAAEGVDQMALSALPVPNCSRSWAVRYEVTVVGTRHNERLETTT